MSSSDDSHWHYNDTEKSTEPLTIQTKVKPDKKPSNPKDQAAIDRVDLSLIPDTALAHLAVALHEGHSKYGAYNWRVADVAASVYVAACRRHVNKWWNGENVDPNSLVSELAHAMASCAILIDAIECGKLIDDRPPKVDLHSLHERLRATVRHIQAKHTNSPGRYTELNSRRNDGTKSDSL